MRREIISDAVGKIDEKYIEEAKMFFPHVQKRKKTLRTWGAVAACFILAIAIGVVGILRPWQGNTVYAKDLMEGVIPNEVEETELDPAFVQAAADFSIALFQKGQTVNENSLISPLSVYLALAMTANGAGGDTQKALEQVLGDGMSVDELNTHAYTLLQRLCNETQETLAIHNSIWLDQKRSGSVYPEFLQKNADYYKAEAFQLDFSHENEALEQINQWVKNATDGEVEEALKEIDGTTVLLLLNTILFESKWTSRYHEFEENAPFQNADGTWILTRLMKAKKQYIESENAIGFISDYRDERFRFVALLPKEGTSLEEYVANLTGEEFLNTINSESDRTCMTYLPPFDYEYETDLAQPLQEMGLESMFDADRSDFSNLSSTGKKGELYISKVEHQTFIVVDEEQTRAGAVTVEHLVARGEEGDGREVILDRPFLYAIIDSETKLPIFLGTVNQLEGEETQAPAYSTTIEEVDGSIYQVVNKLAPHTVLLKGSQETRELFFHMRPEALSWPITLIGEGAYADHENLEQVYFYRSGLLMDLRIEQGAFANCKNLKRVIFSDDITIMELLTIEDGAFEGCDQVVFYLPVNYANYAQREPDGVEAYAYAVKHHIPVEFYDPEEVSWVPPAEVTITLEGREAELKRVQTLSLEGDASPDRIAAFCVTKDGYIAIVDGQENQVSIFLNGTYCGGFAYDSPGAGVLFYDSGSGKDPIFCLLDSENFTVFTVQGDVWVSRDVSSLMEGRNLENGANGQYQMDITAYDDLGCYIIYEGGRPFLVYENGEFITDEEELAWYIKSSNLYYAIDTEEDAITWFTQRNYHEFDWMISPIAEEDQCYYPAMNSVYLFVDYTPANSPHRYLLKYNRKGEPEWKYTFPTTHEQFCIVGADGLAFGRGDIYVLRYEESEGQYAIYQIE